MFLTVKAQVHADRETEAVLKDAMFCATKVYNGLLWHLREGSKETGKVNLSWSNINRIIKELPQAKGYYSLSVRMTCLEVMEAYRSFFALKKNGRVKHNAPGFRRKTALSPLKYVQSGFKVVGDRVTVSLGTSRPDGVRRVSFRVSRRSGISLSNLRELSIIYDKLTGRLEARLVVEVQLCENAGTGRAAVDLGETVLLAAAFDDGGSILYSGRLIKSIRRYWQKVRAKVKPPSKEQPRMSRHYRQIARKERRQVEHLLHIVSKHFVEECVMRGVGEIVFGDLTGRVEGRRFGRMNQRLHAWAFHKLTDMVVYKAALVGIAVRKHDENGTSITCHACGVEKPSNRKSRGLYLCRCGWTAHADINAALNIYERAYNVSPVKGSSGLVARPVVLSFRMDRHTVHEPKRRITLRPSA
ncbi:RNA-guided endonuclease InsQ/TnpB family protein [Thermincola ferriacetica]|uniref:RNA-guided endonuclease InsQ/TnpB family protein n=1 Tax=Thermincola ferriacetica TaxID=281456 RepID=UPI000AC4DB10|nr:RNA-guided endonuclease TnpB family protein [Thermincola ferriacetica]